MIVFDVVLVRCGLSVAVDRNHSVTVATAEVVGTELCVTLSSVVVEVVSVRFAVCVNDLLEVNVVDRVMLAAGDDEREIENENIALRDRPSTLEVKELVKVTVTDLHVDGVYDWLLEIEEVALSFHDNETYDS